MRNVSPQGKKTKDDFDQLTTNEKATAIRDVGILESVQCARVRRKEKAEEDQTKWAHGMGEGLANEGEYAYEKMGEIRSRYSSSARHKVQERASRGLNERMNEETNERIKQTREPQKLQTHVGNPSTMVPSHPNPANG